MMNPFMDNLFAIASIVLIVAYIAVRWVVSRYRRMLALSTQLERERALEKDAARLASAKLKFRNILGKQGRKRGGDPLMELYGVEVPTDCQPS